MVNLHLFLFHKIILAFFFLNRMREKLNSKRFMKLKHANYFIIFFYHFKAMALWKNECRNY